MGWEFFWLLSLIKELKLDRNLDFTGEFLKSMHIRSTDTRYGLGIALGRSVTLVD